LIGLVGGREDALPLLELLLMKVQTKVAAAVALAVLIGAVAWTARSTGDQVEGTASAAAPVAGGLEGPDRSLPNLVAEPEREPVAAAEAPAEPHGPQEVVEEPRSAVRGRVRDSEGRPIAGAAVAATASSLADLNWSFGTEDEPFAEIPSDAKGEFELPLAPARAADLAISAPGFGTARFARRRAGDVVDVVLDPGGSLAGRIVARDGSGPVSGAAVLVRATENSAHNPALASATSDERGEYRIDDLGARDYWVSAAAKGCGATALETVTVRAAERTVKDFEVQVGIEVRIRGRVLDALDRAPIAGAVVYRGDDRTTSDGRGEFDLPVVVPSTAKSASANVRAAGRQVGEASVPLSEAAEREVEVLLERAWAVRGRVSTPDGRPVRGAQVRLQATSTATPATRSSEDGYFEIGGLRPGARYALQIVADGFASAVYDLPALESEPVAPVELGDVVLAAPSSLSGRIVDERGSPWSDCPIELAGENADRSRFAADRVPGIDSRIGKRSGKTDSDGRFVFGELARGEYVVRARVAGRPRLLERPVSVGEADSAEIEIVVPRGLTVAGRVVDPEGLPVAGVFVRIDSLASPAELLGSASTSSDGAFEVAGLEPGSCELSTAFSGVAPAAARARLTHARMRVEAGAVPFDVVLPLSAEIRGRVTGAGGTALAGATVLAFADAPGAEANARTNASGEFRLVVRAGATYRLRLLMPGSKLAALGPEAAAASRAMLEGVAAGTVDLELRIEE
jgi:hypothetical protein